MELKLVSVTALVDTEVRFNRTFMELKQGGGGRAAERGGRFNRTFMELKLR